MDRLSSLAPDVAALQDGRPWPLGASVGPDGVNFAVVSAQATAIELCLFDATGRHETSRQRLPARSGDVWHGLLPGAAAGLLYGYRASGPWQPELGLRFNAHKLLLDPWAREIVGDFDWSGAHGGARAEAPQEPDRRDNGGDALKARVVAAEPPAGASRPRAADDELLVYELHVRGFTQCMPQVPQGLRGTYLGLASEPAIAHLKRLGVNAVQLLPVQQAIDEQHLVRHGLRNYWGYNTIGFFCPSPRYATRPDGASARSEFRSMVQALHAAGIEVMLDVVYNHTPEADERGPTLSWRGLDNTSWYRLPPDRKAGYENHSGCGNTLDLRQPRAIQLVLDSLRYWVQQMGVDGFRFDLAPVLGRGDQGFDRRHAFFTALQQDPVLAGVRLIAEPWDIGPGGWQLGQFPAGWLEWNDRFRDTARAFWLGGDCTRGELARRLCGSADIFQARGRRPLESVNYVTSHDGFTLKDLVSYDLRHNEANQEGNRDGHGHNLSWNCGWEGPTEDPGVLSRRARLQRALLATVLLGQGTPMLAAGSEMGHSQRGNNNAYCQDNEISWLDWSQADHDLLRFVAHVSAVRRRRLPLGPRWYNGLPDARGRPDLTWWRRTGEPLDAGHWSNRMSRIFGATIARPGRPGPALLLLVNARETDADFLLPAGRWQLEVDSAEPHGWRDWAVDGGQRVPLRARSLLLLAEDADPDAP
jgi:glycogen operon protein